MTKRIAIIGSSFAGLLAARSMTKQGYDVHIFECQRRIGGKLQTFPFMRKTEMLIDVGYTQFLEGDDFLYMEIIREMEQCKVLARINNYSNRNDSTNNYVFWIAPKGVKGVSDYLSRWANIHLNQKVVGLTRLSHQKNNNGIWAVHLGNSSFFHADAVIIATSVNSAIDLLYSTTNEYPIKLAITQLTKVTFEPSLALAIGSWTDRVPSWKQKTLNHRFISHITNESFLHKGKNLNLVAYFYPSIYWEYLAGKWDEWKDLLTREVLSNLDVHALYPMHSHIFTFENYYLKKSLSIPFLNIAIEKAPLTCVGDYFLEGGLIGSAKSVSHLLSKWNV